MTPRPNERLTSLGHLMIAIAPRFTAVLQHLAREEALCDGFTSATMGDGMPRGSSEDSTVEAAAAMRYAIRSERETFRDDLDAAEQVVQSLAYRLNEAAKLYAPIAKPPICDGSGLEGAKDRYLPNSKDPNNGWFKPGCGNFAEHGKLCSACYRRAQRWRQERDLPALADGRTGEVAA